MTGKDRPDHGLSTRESDVAYEVDETERHSRAVVRAVASLRNTPVLELEPLYDTVDPDSIDELFDRAGGIDAADSSVTFEFGGCDVTVTPTAVLVRERKEAG